MLAEPEFGCDIELYSCSPMPSTLYMPAYSEPELRGGRAVNVREQLAFELSFETQETSADSQRYIDGQDCS